MVATVPAVGSTPNTVLLCAKGPGREEILANRPHVGRAGREQKSYLDRHGLSPYTFRLTNLCREFVSPDTRLTPQQILEWEPDLLSEIERTRPRLIIAVGADPTQFFLGRSASLSTVHGIPHRAGTFDSGLSYRAPLDCCILPVIQPAAGFHSPDSRALINWDFSQVARVYKLIKEGRESEIDYRDDPYAGLELYRDVTGGGLESYLLGWDYLGYDDGSPPPLIALDTEGTPSDPFSVQVCLEPGRGFLLRYDQPDFQVGIRALQDCANRGSIFTGHNIGMYDLEMFRKFRLDLFHANVHDTLWDAYLFCLEPLGLKANAWRHLGMRMKSHAETVGGLGRDLQIEYLHRALAHTLGWPKPEPVFKVENSGQLTIKNPNTIASRIRKILQDIETGIEDPEDIEDDSGSGDDFDEEKVEGVDPLKRWRAVKKDLRETVRRVEADLGRMPSGSIRLLWEKDPEAALHYACMDVDAHYRLYGPFTERLEREGKTRLAEVYSANMHVFSEMQENGMPTRRKRLAALRDELTQKMLSIVAEISQTYNNGEPYNPKSSPQTAVLFDRWGLRGTKKTKGGKNSEPKMSYGKKSVEHLKFTDDTMTEEEKFRRNLVVLRFEWLNCQHTRDMFCTPVLDLLDEDVDECTVRCQILPWGTQQRRLAAKRPNFLAQPKWSVLGKAIRDCYEAPEGYVFLESDLSSIEVWVMAHESGDLDLIRIGKSGVKFHRETASRLFNTPRELVDDTQYLVGKRTIFGTFYGQSGSGLREQLWMQNLTQFDDDACQRFIDDVKYKVYPGIGKYERRVENEIRWGKGGKPGKPTPDAGSVRDMWGMQRYLPGIWSDDRGVAAEAVRFGVSLKISGGAQGLIQEAITWLKDEIRRLRDEMGIDVLWRLTVHDSLLLTCPEWAVEIVKAVVEEGLTKHCGAELSVPVRAESKTARTWGGL